MQALLSFANSPPLRAPARFLLTAPWFAVLAGLLAAVDGPAMLDSRWTPAALAATHLITLGFMLQVMLGALIQVMPVVAGASLPRPAWVAAAAHAGLSAGTLLLAAGFLAAMPVLLQLAAGVLGVSITLFLGAASIALWPVPTTSPTIAGLKLALATLLATSGLGIFLALALAGGWSLPLQSLADLHAAWGLAGWSGVLLAAVAYVVVPMFQLTPGYPTRPARAFPWLLVLPLVLWSLALWGDWPGLARLAQASLALAGAAFAGLTLRLQAQRRRARPDTTLRYWQFGLVATILAMAMLLTAACAPAVSELTWWTPLFGVIVLAGGFMPLIIGMLYKILPFLGWMHLRNLSAPGVVVPAMGKLLPELAMRHQAWGYFAAFIALTAAAFWPEYLVRPAGALFAAANAWLGWNLLQTARRYRQHRSSIARTRRA